MTPLEIQFALRKKGITQKALAKELGISEMTISDVILKKRISNKVMRAVAQKIDRDYRIVFSEYYLKTTKHAGSKTIGDI
jgi:transcriptional regulator with XRE-family HTH domain